ncbi:DUF21 domain-containing protein At2g14520-like isoform X2 [Papaver somniferum]|uniref:DUF21 domain-containing protein At2g14520-like isoform X2 n=1 Tax=Papaver somniferum TaxID=3469 RepID=UPI000E6F80D4|nr:DUF21 domain-containing protein At2g14520-like isoform X2 [Papaver somniferum]
MAANDVPCCQSMFWIYLVICVALVLFAGLMSGLTLGLMSLSLVDLEVLSKAGKPQDRKNAAKILPIVKNQHLLLCTLLIGNALAMEALPIFLDSIAPAWIAIVVSVTLILAFGEIVPQAVCSHYGLSVGAKMVLVVRLLMVIFFPITYPISKLLDWLLGKGHSVLLRRAELKTLVDMHGNEAGKGGELTHDETTIITGALDLTQKTAKDSMTPISETFSLDIDSKLDVRTMCMIMSKGHSRIPVFSGNPTNIVGLILVKNLIFCNPADEILIRNTTIRKIPRVQDDLPLYEILNEFQMGHSHMAVVVKSMKKDMETPDSTKDSMSDTISGLNKKRTQQDQNGRVSDSVIMIDAEKRSPATRNSNTERCKELDSPIKKMERVGDLDDIVNYADLDSLSADSADEEVIGIITMEDVIEELLQEEIFDETDQSVDVQNKITTIPGRMSSSSPNSSSSPSTPAGRFSVYHVQKRNQLASPLHPYYQTPIIHSPVSPYIQSPVVRPSLCSSPLKSLTPSPAEHITISRDSPNRAARKPYEKLRKLESV